MLRFEAIGGEAGKAMDLGLKGRNAIICASNRGLGKACAIAFAEAGCAAVINGCDEAVLLAVAAEIARSTGAKVIPGRKTGQYPCLPSRPAGGIRQILRFSGERTCRIHYGSRLLIDS